MGTCTSGFIDLPEDHWLAQCLPRIKSLIVPAPTPLLCTKSLNSLSDDLLVHGILRFLHYKEVSQVLLTRPQLSRLISIAFLVQSFDPADHDCHVDERIMWETFLRYHDKIHMPSSHRFCRIMEYNHRDNIACETCGNHGASYTRWFGLFLCVRCEHQTHCTYSQCRICNGNGQGKSTLRYFSRWLVTQAYPTFCRKTFPFNARYEEHLWNDDFVGVTEMRNQLDYMRVARYSNCLTGWAGVLTNSNLCDPITGEPIGPFVTDELVTQTMDQGQSAQDFLKSLPEVPDWAECMDALREFQAKVDATD